MWKTLNNLRMGSPYDCKMQNPWKKIFTKATK